MELGASWSQQLGGNYARMTHVFWTASPTSITRYAGYKVYWYTITTVCSTIIVFVLVPFFMCSFTPSLEMCSLGEGNSNRTRNLRQ